VSAHTLHTCMLLQSLVTCARNSLLAIKTRVFRRMESSFLFVSRPFFEVDVQLSVPSVTLSPSLEDVQAAVNRTAMVVLNCFKNVWEWGQLDVTEPEPDKVRRRARLARCGCGDSDARSRLPAGVH
jgi:dynein heavy chain